MSLPRKDVRVRLDHDVHESLLVISKIDGLLPAEWVEQQIEALIAKRVHNARLIVSQVSHTISARKRVEDRGNQLNLTSNES